MGKIGKALAIACFGKDGYDELFLKSRSFGRVSDLDNAAVMQFRFPSLEAVWGQYTDTNLTILYHTVAEIFAPISMIAIGVAGGQYKLKKVSDNSVVENNKWINSLLISPNVLQNWSEFVFQKEIFELTTGKSFVYANAPDTMPVNYRTIATVQNLQVDATTIRLHPVLKPLSATAIEDLILMYVTSNGNAAPVDVPTHKVLYTKQGSINAQDLNIYGRSALLSAEKAISNLIKVYEARNVIYSNRGALGIISSAKTDATGNIPLLKREKEELQEDFTAYGVQRGKYPFMITNQAIEYTSIGASIKDMEPFTETLADAEVIYATYRVPRDLMPKSEGATFENQNNAEKRLYNDVIIPRAKSLCKSLTRFWKLDEQGLYLDVEFGHVAALQENLKEKSAVDWRNNETYRVRFANGIVTLNDWRISCKLEASKNPLYDKLIFDMTPEELAKVEQVLKLGSGNSNKAAGEGGNSPAGSESDSAGN